MPMGGVCVYIYTHTHLKGFSVSQPRDIQGAAKSRRQKEFDHFFFLFFDYFSGRFS